MCAQLVHDHVIGVLFALTAWEVAGEYIYTTPGGQDSGYMMLSLNVPGYRWVSGLITPLNWIS